MHTIAQRPAPGGMVLSHTGWHEGSGLSVVIPAHNEEGSARAVVEGLHAELGTAGFPYEILVVDDGSQDGTVAESEAAGAVVLSHARNRGYGAALKTGIRHATHEFICIIDADGTYPASYIPKLIDHLRASRSDMVVGARTGESVAIPLVRRPAKWVLGKLAELVSGFPIPDLNSGLRIFRRDAGMRFFGLLPDGFSFTTTITLAMLSNGYLVHYVPINYLQRVGRSKIRPIRDTVNFTIRVLRIGLYFAPLKIFLPISALVLLLALAWGVTSKLVLGQLADVSTVVMVMAAVQIGVVGLLAELINRRLPTFLEKEEPPLDGRREPAGDAEWGS